MDSAEVWKSVVGYEGRYEISTSLRVASLPRKGRLLRRILKQSLNSHGCPVVALCVHGKQTIHYISHLVADAFLPPKSPTDQVLRHLNDDPTDNRIENLAWGTRKDNAQDAMCNGKRPTTKGTANGMAKLTEDDVREIRRLYATGNYTLKELAIRFGVSNVAIGYIVWRETWKHVV
jgi:hypothetical protein